MFRRMLLSALVVFAIAIAARSTRADDAKPIADHEEFLTRKAELEQQKVWLDSLTALALQVTKSGSALHAARMSITDPKGAERLAQFDQGIRSGNLDYSTRPPESFIQASLIRTITSNSTDKGATSREFLDVRLKLVGGPRYFTMANVDADMLAGEQRDSTTLRDASFSLNYVPVFSTQYRTARTTFVGALFRIFDGTSYYGLQLGGQELSRSALAPSTVSGAIIWPITTTFEKTFRKHNGQPAGLLLDFFLCDGDTTSFLNKLNLRGTILFDLEHAQNPNYRFVVEVPFARYRNLP